MIDDVVADVLEFLERATVTDVELGECDRAVAADLLGAVVRAGDRDVALRRGEGEDVVEGGSYGGIVETDLAPCDDLCGETGAIGAVRLEHVLHLLRLTVGQREVGAIVGSDAGGDDVHADQ